MGLLLLLLWSYHNFLSYSVDPETELLDFDISWNKPRSQTKTDCSWIASAYSQIIDFQNSVKSDASVRSSWWTWPISLVGCIGLHQAQFHTLISITTTTHKNPSLDLVVVDLTNDERTHKNQFQLFSQYSGASFRACCGGWWFPSKEVLDPAFQGMLSM